VTIDESTGAIKGKFKTAPSQSEEHTVIASNARGEKGQTRIAFRVEPIGFFYPGADATFSPGQTVGLMPHIVGKAPTRYEIEPAKLPDGLKFDAKTGHIDGTLNPDQKEMFQAFIITGFLQTGETTSVEIYISVTESIDLPESLAYVMRPAYFRGAQVKILPKVTGGQPTHWKIRPKLPDNLEINPHHGAITGTISLSSHIGDHHFTITAKNSAGQVSYNMILPIRAAPPKDFKFPNIEGGSSAGSFNMCGSVGIEPELQSGGLNAVVVYSISPPLPMGLKLNSKTGEVSGKLKSKGVDYVWGHHKYTVTARNTVGTKSAQLTIELAKTKCASMNILVLLAALILAIILLIIIYYLCCRKKQDEPPRYVQVPAAQPAPVVAAPPPRQEGLPLTFDTGTGDWKTVYAKRKPLGVIFERHLPIRVTQEKESHGKEIGIQVGWTLVEIDNQAIAGMSFEEADRLLHEKVDKLPGGIPLTWETGSGPAMTVWAFKKPLGLTFEKQLPIKITKERPGHGMEIGIKEGWELLKVNYKDVSVSSGMTFEQVDTLLHEQLGRLPSAS
jgi:hypothetical protein